MKVFAYIRVSTDEQVEKGNSLFEQQERIIAYCKAMGWEEPHFYIEDGYSAKSINRPALTQMLDDIRYENYSHGIVITTKLDRLSRRLMDILKLVEFFDKYNFKYVSQSESFDTSTPAGRLVLQMLGMVAEFERERISERVRDNMLSLAKNSKKIITRPCFGYNIIDGQMVINIEEALIIKRGASALLSGIPSRTVYGGWNSDGIKTKEGNEWYDKTFRDLYKRETLVGDFVYNKTYKKGNKVIKRDPSEWIVIENHHDPILDRDTFQKLQDLFEGRKSVGKQMSNDTYLLSGLVYCGHCQSKMNGKTNRNFSKRLNRENIHYTYTCDGYLKKSKCFHHFANRDNLEQTIINRIIEVSQAAPGTLQLVVSEKSSSPKEDKNTLLSKLDKLDKKIQKQIDAYNDDLITAHDLKVASERAKAEREKLTEMLNNLERGSSEKKEKEIINHSKRIVKDVTSTDRITAKQAIRNIIERIEIINGSEIKGITWRTL